MKIHPDHRLPALLVVFTLLAIIGHFASQPSQKVVEENSSLLAQCDITLSSEVQEAGIYGDVHVACEPILQNASLTISVADAQMNKTTLSTRIGSLSYFDSRSLLPTGSTALCVHILNTVTGKDVEICQSLGS